MLWQQKKLRDLTFIIGGGGDGSKIGGSPKIIWGMEGGVQKVLHSNRGVYEK